MNIYDIIIVIILIIFALAGFKRGGLKSIVSFVGFILVIVLAYNLKGIVGDFLTLNFPFFDLGGVKSLNIILYQTIAFFIIMSILLLLYRILLIITGIFEKIFKMTIVLGIPSKILGLIFGLIEGYIVVYLLLFFLAQPFININLDHDSNYARGILDKTPIISNYANKSLEVFKEIEALTNYEDKSELDLAMAEIILKDNVTSIDVMKKLVDTKKLDIPGIDDIINKYSKEVNDD